MTRSGGRVTVDGLKIAYLGRLHGRISRDFRHGRLCASFAEGSSSARLRGATSMGLR